ncbi:restriction endonuclease subunit S [Chryseobacterium nepalense]|uniref:restriction endonuclease subunit S n=1 Tax=Chryseobacterium nepalense TaxID=1854498 RepID=UPI002E0A65D2|nr:type I restriction enzyme S subunit [Chryseobacterium nepalense]
MSYRKIGDLIQLVDHRNKDLAVTHLVGLTINKKFIPSVANTIGTDMANYKLIRKNQFACSTMQVRRDKKMPIALLKEFDIAIISQAYPVFEVIDENVILPDYLMLWFSRSEFDREACFHAVGGVRGSLEWEDFCGMQLPVPSIEEQRQIVVQYQSIANKINVNEQICEKLEAAAQALYKHWFVDFEFPVQSHCEERGTSDEAIPSLGYKSSGGTMVWNEELGKEIPEGWESGTIGDLFTFQRGHDLPSQRRIKGDYPIFASTGISEYHNEFKINKPTIITGRSGSLGELFYYDQPCWPLNTSLYIINFKKAKPFYSLYFLQTVNLKELGAGSAVPTLNRNDIHMISNEIPNIEIVDNFENKIKEIVSLKNLYIKQNLKLTQLQSLLLSRLAVGEEMSA